MNDQENGISDISEVRKVFQAFQDGYTYRDRDQVNAFVDALFVPEEDVEIIGTGAVRPGAADHEWCIGLAAVRRLIDSDWEGWGDVVFDVEDARIFTTGDAAWLSTPGTVSMRFPLEETSQRSLDAFKKLLEEPAPVPHMQLLELARRTTSTLDHLMKGENFVWPFRFTAVLVKRQGRWLFHQMHFSFPTTSFPDERL